MHNCKTVFSHHITKNANIVLFCIISCLSTPCPASANLQTVPRKSIVFNRWYHSGKEKWQGPVHDKLLFTWMTVATSAENEQKYRKLIENQRKKGVKFIGYYYSSTMSVLKPAGGDYNAFPEAGIPPTAIKYEWILRDANDQLVTSVYNKNNYFLDVGAKKVQDAILLRAINNAKRFGTNLLYLDNWYYKFWAPKNLTIQQWTEKCLSLLIRARELTGQANMKLVVNTSSPPENWPEFAPYIDGVAYEMGVHPDRLKTREKYESELRSYEKVTEMGKSVFLFANILAWGERRWDEDGRKIAATAMLVIKEDQPYWGGIYISPPLYEVWPAGGWLMWPEQLGIPLGVRQWNGNTVTRKFERGSISVTVGENPKFSISFEY